ncbi:MAG: TetR/AcrR family transcriptional regulator [Anaerolineaceae bacterium]|nr:TetR/AcrR family transcriptional regulator [Anaerolineaceae bacterium]
MSANFSQENVPEDTRRRIITAAMQLFGQVGYSQSTTHAIAEAAGVNEITLFRHFGSKKNLLMACMQAFTTASFSATFESDLTGNYAEDILRMAHFQIQDTTANMEIIRLLVCDARNIPELRDAMLTGSRANLARLSAYFQRQIDLNVVRADMPAELLASAFDSLFSSNIIFNSIFEDDLSPHLSAQASIRPLVDLFVQGTRNHL